jgi:hypothetical protein
MSTRTFHRLAVGAVLVAAGAGLLAAGFPAGVAWALIVWAMVMAVLAADSRSSRGWRWGKAPPRPARQAARAGRNEARRRV